MPRFVILEHDHPHLHWDLMLECGNVLQTWRLEKPPTSGEPIRAEPLGDHRLLYLDYEGPVSGQRGFVKKWDQGNYQEESSEIIVEKEKMVLRFEGRMVKGKGILEKGDENLWVFSISS